MQNVSCFRSLFCNFNLIVSHCDIMEKLEPFWFKDNDDVSTVASELIK